MRPGRYNFICPQGSTFMENLTYEIDDLPVDLTGYTARMQVREKVTSTAVIVNLTTENGGIALGGDNGTILLTIDHEDTSLLKPKKYVYDLEIISISDIVTRLLEGEFCVTPEVTR